MIIISVKIYFSKYRTRTWGSAPPLVSELAMNSELLNLKICKGVELLPWYKSSALVLIRNDRQHATQCWSWYLPKLHLYTAVEVGIVFSGIVYTISFAGDNISFFYPDLINNIPLGARCWGILFNFAPYHVNRG